MLHNNLEPATRLPDMDKGLVSDVAASQELLTCSPRCRRLLGEEGRTGASGAGASGAGARFAGHSFVPLTVEIMKSRAAPPPNFSRKV